MRILAIFITPASSIFIALRDTSRKSGSDIKVSYGSGTMEVEKNAFPYVISLALYRQ